MELKGIHHVSAITANARANKDFYTNILGLRLVKKTVNQDTPSMYHLFYADETGSPGTDLTFFEIPRAGKTYQGNNSISATSLRVPNDKALSYWQERFKRMSVPHEEIKERAGRLTLAFNDFEGQRLILVSDENNKGVKGGTPWGKSPIPKEFGIVGLGPSQLTIANIEGTVDLFTNVLGFRKKGQYASSVKGQPDIVVYETGEGGTGAEIHLEHRLDVTEERPGRGSVHHIALRVDNEEEFHAWIDKLNEHNIAHSGFVDRFYFRSVYLKDPNGITIELATDGPGFDIDEELEHLGESLALPPFLEHRREEIEARLKPLD
ncbi:glyoxalase family protein [Bacillus thermophilus]|uniref:Glyoxalase family protein n=1 Tax=Siminovitchia thermophila TaxID=1245522 RepID=A0ABS2R2W4_9BACI|nr:ring-cleaving dioxygenase [Siminovitchia thermophila]MBM7713976.1 glyoxalase family protein [Siminovitchia thermophila]ONK23857.1 ring-cleaving dioxygenase [Bacillus sp. VT-16-64]